ncbi:hypothetical protein FRC04_002776 [Tulasnella sp. 424]|nr:hypothetical protein FRC04_002776 [Tulasnella sp. 424]
MPNPLEGTINLQDKPSAAGGFSIIYKGTWIHDGEESIVCVKRLRMNSTDLPQRGLSKEQRLERLKDAAQGLAYLHSQTPPIAHGDLNPGNIFIRTIDDVPTAALSDFGLSRVITGVDAHTGLTTAGAVMGTIGFSAAELLSEETLPTSMSDVYALAGVILFAMSGERPFHNKKTAATILAICRGENSQPVDHPGLPENDPLWQFLRLCWSLVPENRPTADGVIAQLDEVIAGN